MYRVSARVGLDAWLIIDCKLKLLIVADRADYIKVFVAVNIKGELFFSLWLYFFSVIFNFY